MDEPKKKRGDKKKYRDFVVKFRRGVHKAKNGWVKRLISTLEKNMDNGNGHDSQWDIVKELKKGYQKSRSQKK